MNILSVSIILSLSLSFSSLALEQIDITVPVDAQHEECFFLDQESVITYQYKTTIPLDFNLHYHDDNGMNYLIELPMSSVNKKSVKQLTSKQVYCLMWVNSSTHEAELTYEFTVEK